MSEKVESIKKWFKKYPYAIAIFYLIFYLSVFSWLEKNVVPKYIIHCKLDEDYSILRGVHYSICELVCLCAGSIYLV